MKLIQWIFCPLLLPAAAAATQVGDFKALALRAEGDTTLRQQLQTLLKLPREKWDDCVAQAKGAVFPDSRQRAWFADRGASLGLLYTATLGEVDLKRPEGGVGPWDSHMCCSACSTWSPDCVA